MKEKMLVRGVEHVQCEMLRELLLNNGIPSRVRERGSGNYLSILMGYSCIGEELVVREEDYDRGRRLVEAFQPGLDFGDDEAPPVVDIDEPEVAAEQTAEQTAEPTHPIFFTRGKALLAVAVVILVLIFSLKP